MTEQQNAEIFFSKSVSLLYVSLTGEISNCSFGALFVCQPTLSIEDRIYLLSQTVQIENDDLSQLDC